MNDNSKVVTSSEEKAGNKFSNTQNNTKDMSYKTALPGEQAAGEGSWHKDIMTKSPEGSVNEG